MKKTTILLGFILTIFSINIHAIPIPGGTYTVGTTLGTTYTSLTNAGGFFADVNSRGLAGNIIINITSDITETSTNSLNQWTESGVGGYKITINPSAASLRTLSGNPALPLINFNGAD